jgi:hypothetical protein
VAPRFKAWTLFARSNADIVGSNPTQGMDVCVCVYSECMQRPWDGLITRPMSPTVCVKNITELKKRPGPNKGLWSHWWMKCRKYRPKPLPRAAATLAGKFNSHVRYWHDNAEFRKSSSVCWKFNSKERYITTHSYCDMTAESWNSGREKGAPC